MMSSWIDLTSLLALIIINHEITKIFALLNSFRVLEKGNSSNKCHLIRVPVRKLTELTAFQHQLKNRICS